MYSKWVISKIYLPILRSCAHFRSSQSARYLGRYLPSTCVKHADLRSPHSQTFKSPSFRSLSTLTQALKPEEGVDDTVGKLENLLESGFVRIDDVLWELENKGPLSDKNDIVVRGLTCLKSLAVVPDIKPEERISLAEKIIGDLENQNLEITQAHYEALLECYLASKNYQKCESLISSLKLKNKEVSDMMQFLLLKSFSEAGEVDKVSSLLPELVNKEFSIESLYACNIYALGASSDISKACDLLKEMEEKGIAAGSQVYTSLLRVAVVNNNEEMFKKYLNESKEKNINFSDDDFSSILESAGEKNFHLIPMIVKELGNELSEPIVQNVLLKMMYSGEVDSAFSIYTKLLEIPSLDWSDFHSHLINCVKTFKYPLGKIVETLNPLIEYETCKYVFKSILHQTLKEKDIVKSLGLIKFLLKNGVNIESHYIWPIIVAAHEKMGIQGMFGVLNVISKCNITFNDIDTYRHVIVPRIESAQLRRHFKGLSGLRCINASLLYEVTLLDAMERGLISECHYFRMYFRG